MPILPQLLPQSSNSTFLELPSFLLLARKDNPKIGFQVFESFEVSDSPRIAEPSSLSAPCVLIFTTDEVKNLCLVPICKIIRIINNSRSSSLCSRFPTLRLPVHIIDIFSLALYSPSRQTISFDIGNTSDVPNSLLVNFSLSTWIQKERKEVPVLRLCISFFLFPQCVH
jgi:hypothetical protein